MQRPLIIYHDSCADGFTAAWCAWRKFGDDAEYLPASYGQEPPHAATLSGRQVYVLDFSYKRPALSDMAQACNRLTVLDHHKIARAELEGLVLPGLTVRFDMEKCGARLAWEFFFPGETAPFLIDVVEDRDLWRWKLYKSKELSAWLATVGRTFEGWSQIANDLSAPCLVTHSHPTGRTPAEEWHYDGVAEHAIEQGAAVLRYQAQVVEAHCKNAVEVEISGHRVLAVNATSLMSEIGERLAQGRPFGATWFARSDGKKVWSLRSREGGVDVSEVARKMGGGGHRQAAGFEE